MLLLAFSIAFASVYFRMKQYHTSLAWCFCASIVFYNTLVYHESMNNLSYDAIEYKLNKCEEDVHNALASIHKCVTIKAGL